MSPAARAYLNQALTILEQHSIDVQQATWPRIAARARAAAVGATTPAQTYPAIRLAITLLGDWHTTLVPPTEFHRTAHGHFVKASRPSGHLIDRRYGLIAVPTFEGSKKATDLYVEHGVAVMRRLAPSSPCGWVVDLRGNTGGDMWPMLTTVLPLLTTHTVGYFVQPDGKRFAWRIHDGKAYNGRHLLVDRGNPIRVHPRDPAVAILIDHYTASAAEAVVVAFHGQQQTRTFGQPTAGVPSGNAPFPLSDGAELLVTSGWDADRNGQRFQNLHPIQPDVPVYAAPPVQRAGTQPKLDPTTRRAVRWLADTRDCRGTS